MKKIKTTDALGHVLCHDMTQIIKDVRKDAVFRKGHIVTEQDIPVLLSMGKENLYVWEKNEDMLHEDEAAEILRNICKSENISASEPKEGKIELFSEINGLFKVDVERMNRINALGEIIISTRHTNTPVKKGNKLAGTRVIPLLIDKAKMEKALVEADNTPLMQVLPYQQIKAAIVVTGSEVYHGRIEDAFGPVIEKKISEYDAELISKKIVDDDAAKITQTILEAIDNGANLIICTGGMSVDPDDTTPTAIRNATAELISYGAPVLPGAMFALAYYDNGGRSTPILGLPGCVMYAKRTVFDLILPRILAGDILSADDIAKLGHGGLCLKCDVCTFPNCGFGK